MSYVLTILAFSFSDRPCSPRSRSTTLERIRPYETCRTRARQRRQDEMPQIRSRQRYHQGERQTKPGVRLQPVQQLSCSGAGGGGIAKS